MTMYADAIAKPPRTLTDLEQKLLLKVTGEHRDGFRDHVIISFALGTGLREHEILALDLGDVFDDEGGAKRRVTLRVFKRSADEPAVQEVVLPDLVRAKLGNTLARICGAECAVRYGIPGLPSWLLNISAGSK